MKILPKTINETLDIIQDILKQGDSRYNNTQDEILLAHSIMDGINF